MPQITIKKRIQEKFNAIDSLQYNSLEKKLIINALSNDNIENILFFLQKELGYCVKYFSVCFNINKKIKLIEKEKSETDHDWEKLIFKYYILIQTFPILWEKTEDFNFLLEQKYSIKNIYFQTTKNFLNFCILKTNVLKWKRIIKTIKQILISFQICKFNLGLHFCQENKCVVVNEKEKTKQEEEIFLFMKSNNSVLLNLDQKKQFLIKTFENNALTELSLHTKFSTLDGISSVKDYIKSAKKKDYKAIAITDHYNVQSFPDLANEPKDNLKVIYGCELEMLEDSFSSFLLNFSEKQKKTDINDFVYCIFDTETTGLFSEYNEIIEIGFVLYYKGEIIDQGDFLIQPEEKPTKESLENWYHKSIDPDELTNYPKIEEILQNIRVKWKNCILVAHNAIDFDYNFLNKAWNKIFRENVPNSTIDTLIISHLMFPERKTHSLEKLSKLSSKKQTQEHRALSDSLLLLSFFKIILNNLKEEKITTWEEADQKLKQKKLPNRGKRIKILTLTQQGLYNLYKIITISHTERFLKNPRILRSDITKYREGLFIGTSGGVEGEIFNAFCSSIDQKAKEKYFEFYDYIEVNSPHSNCFLYNRGKIKQKELEDLTKKIIETAQKLNKPIVAGHNVHYCEKKEKILKDIIVSNGEINGSRHYLYKEATCEGVADMFDSMPFQHLLNKEEMIEQWLFLNDFEQIKDLLFSNPEKILQNIEEIQIKPEPIGYETKEIENKKEELKETIKNRAKKLYGIQIPDFITKRINIEWKIIEKEYAYIFWIALKVIQKSHEKNLIIGSRGSVGCSFIAYLCDITELNPLPFHKRCQSCLYIEIFECLEPNYSPYDYTEKETCPRCKKTYLIMEGFNMPMETFFGIAGEKTPDIDLNFSGEYQKEIHDYVRKLLGEKNVHRIGTINTIKQSVSEMFWENFINIRKKLNDPKTREKYLESAPTWSKKYQLEIKENFSEDEIYNKWIETENKETDENEIININNYNQRYKTKTDILTRIQGIKRTTGQHPGGLLINPPDVDINKHTPLNYPADKKSDFTTTHLEYSFLSKFLMKVDILGHDEPKILQNLSLLTGVDALSIPFFDEKTMNVFFESDTLGVTEFGTELPRKILTFLKPTKFSQLVQICGFSHGTNIWVNNQQIIYKKKQLKLNQLIACRDDIWEILKLKGIETYEAFVVSEFCRKGKWNAIPEETKNKIREKLNDDEGKKYLEILEKIIYIIPKAHAIAYTITAWRGAFYKSHFPIQFYSILLTYHITSYDIWLMTLNPTTIEFRLNNIYENIPVYKSSKKELLSTLKVLKKLSNQLPEKIIELVNLFTEKISSTNKKEQTKKNYSRNDFFLTAKEKELMYALSIFAEMDKKQLNFIRGIDLNRSEKYIFKIINNKILFPLSSIQGFGDKAVEKLFSLREQRCLNRNEWYKSLENDLNSNHLKKLLELEKTQILIWNTSSIIPLWYLPF